MIKLFTDDDYNNNILKKLPFKCIYCENIFYIERRFYTAYLKGTFNLKANYCSHKCANIDKKTKKNVNCLNCDKEFEKFLNQIIKSPNHFCSKSCAATYNNAHKTTGTRRSKLEIYLETKLIELYSTLEIHFNRKNTINSELDIYIPSLKLAFELNGIFHYEPIYGQDKLNQITNNDNRKFQACLEQGIELCLIDTSTQKYFKEESSIKYFNIISNIIKERLI